MARSMPVPVVGIIGLVLILLGASFATGLLQPPPLVTVVSSCGTFNTLNPASTSFSNPTPWNQGQSQVLTAHYFLNPGCTIANPAGPPVQVAAECQANCGTGPRYPFTTCTGCSTNAAAASIDTAGYITFIWGSSNSPGITGTASYPTGAVIVVTFLVYHQPVSVGTSPSDFVITDGSFVSGITGNVFDFSISANPTSVSVPVSLTQTASTTITVTGINGYPGPTSLSAGCSSTALTTCSLPGSLSGGSGSAQLTVGSNCCIGNYTVTVTGTYSSTAGNLVHTVVVKVTVTGGAGSPNPDWTMTATPPSVSFPVNGVGKSTLAFLPLNGFTGAISLSTSVDSNNIGGSCSVSPTSISLGPGESVLLSLTATKTGTFTCHITGASASISHTLSVIALTSGGPIQTGCFLPLFSICLEMPMVLILAGVAMSVAGFWPRRQRLR